MSNGITWRHLGLEWRESSLLRCVRCGATRAGTFWVGGRVQLQLPLLCRSCLIEIIDHAQ